MVNIQVLIDVYELTFREKVTFNFGTSLAANSKNNSEIPNARNLSRNGFAIIYGFEKETFFRVAYRMVGTCVAILAMDSMVLFGGI